jgi:hypothetical protein
VDVLGGQWCAIAPLQAFAQIERDGLAIWSGLPAFGKAWLQRPVIGDRQQLVEEQE